MLQNQTNQQPPAPIFLGTTKLCCANLVNRGPTIQTGPKETRTVCRVCGCRHFVMSVDPGVFGIRGF